MARPRQRQARPARGPAGEIEREQGIAAAGVAARQAMPGAVPASAQNGRSARRRSRRRRRTPACPSGSATSSSLFSTATTSGPASIAAPTVSRIGATDEGAHRKAGDACRRWQCPDQDRQAARALDDRARRAHVEWRQGKLSRRRVDEQRRDRQVEPAVLTDRQGAARQWRAVSTTRPGARHSRAPGSQPRCFRAAARRRVRRAMPRARSSRQARDRSIKAIVSTKRGARRFRSTGEDRR